QQFNFAGFFSSIEAQNRNLHLAIGQAGDIKNGCFIKLYFLVDPHNGLIIDARYQSYSNLDIVEVMEVLCAFCIQKTYVQASHITSGVLQKEVKQEVKDINICLE